MHPILRNERLSPNVTRLVLEAPRIAEIRQPGQFVIVHLGRGAERIPLTIADGDAEAGTISRPGDPRNAGWTGRTGRAEHVVASVCKDLGLRPDRTVVYICGNPEMIINVETELMHRGFPEFHVKKELYWPKGKTATMPGA